MCESCGACVPSSQCCAPSGTRVYPMTGYGVEVIDRQAEECATFNVRTVAADGSILADLYAGTSREDRDRAIDRAMVAMESDGTRIARVDVLTVDEIGRALRTIAPAGYVCKRCGGPAPIGIGYASTAPGAHTASRALAVCGCGWSVRTS